MSKEMAVIALGIFVILVRTSLGLPGSWQTPLIILSGVGLAILGFLLRGEAIKRNSSAPARSEGRSYSFVENTPTAPSSPTHVQPQEGITSLN